MEDYSLTLLRCPDVGHTIFLPETGFFILPIFDRIIPHDYGNAFFAPLTPNLSIGMVPKEAPHSVVEQQRDLLMAHSVTPNDGVDVVVLPYSDNYTGERQEAFKAELKKLRTQIKVGFRAFAERKEVLNEMFRKAGLAI